MPRVIDENTDSVVEVPSLSIFLMLFILVIGMLVVTSIELGKLNIRINKHLEGVSVCTDTEKPRAKRETSI